MTLVAKKIWEYLYLQCYCDAGGKRLSDTENTMNDRGKEEWREKQEKEILWHRIFGLNDEINILSCVMEYFRKLSFGQYQELNSGKLKWLKKGNEGIKERKKESK